MNDYTKAKALPKLPPGYVVNEWSHTVDHIIQDGDLYWHSIAEAWLRVYDLCIGDNQRWLMYDIAVPL